MWLIPSPSLHVMNNQPRQAAPLHARPARGLATAGARGGQRRAKNAGPAGPQAASNPPLACCPRDHQSTAGRPQPARACHKNQTKRHASAGGARGPRAALPAGAALLCWRARLARWALTPSWRPRRCPRRRAAPRPPPPARSSRPPRRQSCPPRCAQLGRRRCTREVAGRRLRVCVLERRGQRAVAAPNPQHSSNYPRQALGPMPHVA